MRILPLMTRLPVGKTYKRPSGVVLNVLTGRRDELASNVERVVHGAPDGQSPWEIVSFLEPKTAWHPIGT